MSIQDPRQRPPSVNKRPTRPTHSGRAPDSDFAGLVNLWRGFEEQRQEMPPVRCATGAAVLLLNQTCACASGATPIVN